MLIWKGTEQFLKNSKIRVIKRISYHLVEYLIKKSELHIPRDTIILCQGGGNFGDLYMEHQNLRKLLVKNFPEHKIVILPQTIYYNDLKGMVKDFEIFSKHKNLHLYVRDQISYKQVTPYLKNVYLSQDMAHAMYPIIENKKTKYSTLYFFRKDIEKVEVDYNDDQIDYSHMFDWDNLLSNLDNKIIDIFNNLHNSYKVHKYFPANLLSKLWYYYTGFKIRQAINLFSNYDEIVTSRLHGHILACLMDKKNKVLDNSYGKNSAYFNCWTNKVKGAKLIYDRKDYSTKGQ